MKLRLFFGSILVAAAVACASRSVLPLTTASSLHAAAAAKPSPTPKAVLPLTIISGKSSKAGLQIQLAVAGGSTKPLLFDTGSQSLWIYENAIGPNYTSTNVSATNTYGSGIVYNGTVVTTSVVFTTTHGTVVSQNVPVVLVTAATCDPLRNHGNCPAKVSAANCPKVEKHPPPHLQAGIACLEEGRKLYGTFGADVQPSVEPSNKKDDAAGKKAVIYNLLFTLAPQFIIDQDRVQIGPNPAALAGFTFIAMTPLPSPLPTSLPNGARPYKAHFNLCYRLGTYFKKPYCQESLFDTGADNVNFKGGVTVSIPTQKVGCPNGSKTSKTTLARAGLPLHVYAVYEGKNEIIGDFPTGYTIDWNAAEFTSPIAMESPSVNTGLTFYNRDEIYFDAAGGRIGLHPLRRAGSIGVQTCTPR